MYFNLFKYFVQIEHIGRCCYYLVYLTFLPFLQEGIVIVDSPGVGEYAIMDNIVNMYFPEAFALIYLINSANAGGIQRDRVSLFNYPNLLLTKRESRTREY